MIRWSKTPNSNCSFFLFAKQLLLMEEILHQLIDSLSHYLPFAKQQISSFFSEKRKWKSPTGNHTIIFIYHTFSVNCKLSHPISIFTFTTVLLYHDIVNKYIYKYPNLDPVTVTHHWALPPPRWSEWIQPKHRFSPGHLLHTLVLEAPPTALDPRSVVL